MDNQQPTKKNPTLLAAIIVLVIVIVGAGGYFLLVSGEEEGNTNNTNTVVNTVANENVNVIENTNITVDTNAWVPYNLDEYSIAFKLPQDWTVEKGEIAGGTFQTEISEYDLTISPPDNELDFLPAANCYISQFEIDNDVTISQWIDESGLYVTNDSGEGLNAMTRSDYAIGRFSGLLVKEGAGGPQETISYYFKSGDSLIRFGYYKGVVVEPFSVFKQYSNICATILQSLN